MHYYEVAPTQIIRAGSDTFTYASQTLLSPGIVVSIEVGKKTAIGIITKKVTMPPYDTKEISSVIEPTPLPTPLLELGQWMSSYYSTPLANTLQTLLPRGISKKRRQRETPLKTSIRKRTNFVFTNDQATALTDMHGRHGTVLLHGVTGSGKTAVYIEKAKQTIAQGRSVIVLVPEIALTSQLVDEFQHHFNSIILTHSGQTEAERHLQWQSALHASKPAVVIGPRSALFMPVPSLGLIVVDECHEPSFQQEQSPRYSALRVASKYAGLIDGLAIFGSATPLVADYRLATNARAIIRMSTPAHTEYQLPVVTTVDMTKRANFRQHHFFSDVLLRQLEQTFANRHQALLFHNRRGSASTTLCEQCGWNAGCPRCFVPLTLHADTHSMRCHICGYSSTVPTSCPECHHTDIIHKGIGTKRIETELKKLFPKQVIGRFDGDSSTDDSVHAQYSRLYDGSINVIIGTQVVAKGLDLPKLRTVGIIQADAGLSLPDYGAAERTFQLLTQVIGRVGRSSHASNVIVQSYQPDNPIVVDGLTQNYADFYHRTIAQRQKTFFPPFCFLLKLTVTYKTEATTIKHAQQLAQILRSKLPENTEILGPTPAFYERQRDSYRWQLVIKSTQRSHLLELLKHVPPTHWQYELDPISLL